jgi:hypothetical protein
VRGLYIPGEPHRCLTRQPLWLQAKCSHYRSRRCSWAWRCRRRCRPAGSGLLPYGVAGVGAAALTMPGVRSKPAGSAGWACSWVAVRMPRIEQRIVLLCLRCYENLKN